MKKLFDFAGFLLRHKFIKYCVCGGTSAIVDLGIFFILNEILKVHYLLALTISFPIAVAVNYFLQKKITFKNTYSKIHKQFSVFLLVEIIGWFLNASITAAQVEIIGTWPTLARIVAVIIVTAFTYTSNKKITFHFMKGN